MNARVASLSLACVLLLAAVGSGCSREDKKEQQRALLRPVDHRKERAVAREKRQLFDPQGELIPSEEMVAGVVMPRGLKMNRSFEREWYFRAKRVTLPALERYFGQRLLPMAVERTATSITFKDAQSKDDVDAPVVTVRIATLIGSTPTSSVYIQQAAPPRVFPSEKEVQAKLEAMRRRAE